jgi:hypothetical protein
MSFASFSSCFLISSKIVGIVFVVGVLSVNVGAGGAEVMEGEAAVCPASLGPLR